MLIFRDEPVFQKFLQVFRDKSIAYIENLRTGKTRLNDNIQSANVCDSLIEKPTIPELAQLRRQDPTIPANPTIADAFKRLKDSYKDSREVRKMFCRMRAASKKYPNFQLISSGKMAIMFAELEKLFQPISEEMKEFIPTKILWKAFKNYSSQDSDITESNIFGLQQALDLRAKVYKEDELPDHFQLTVKLDEYMKKVKAQKTKNTLKSDATVQEEGKYFNLDLFLESAIGAVSDTSAIQVHSTIQSSSSIVIETNESFGNTLSLESQTVVTEISTDVGQTIEGTSASITEIPQIIEDQVETVPVIRKRKVLNLDEFITRRTLKPIELLKEKEL